LAGIDRHFIGDPDPQQGCKHPLTGVLSSPMTEPSEASDSLFEYVLGMLEASKGKWSAVAEGSGVSYRTLEKIARREIKNPGISHVEKLAKYFREQAAA
jgi:hypothetical protein